MKIIKPGNPDLSKSVHRFICVDCGCIFEAGRAEYQTMHDFRNGLYFSINCPTCKASIRMYPEDERK